MLTYPVSVEMDDGTTHRVVIDQRDFAALEAQEFPERARVTMSRFLAYSAMRRNKLTTATWEDFNGSKCVRVDDSEPDESEGEQGLDPGQKAVPGASSSPSPSGPGSRSRRS